MKKRNRGELVLTYANLPPIATADPNPLARVLAWAKAQIPDQESCASHCNERRLNRSQQLQADTSARSRRASCDCLTRRSAEQQAEDGAREPRDAKPHAS